MACYEKYTVNEQTLLGKRIVKHWRYFLFLIWFFFREECFPLFDVCPDARHERNIANNNNWPLEIMWQKIWAKVIVHPQQQKFCRQLSCSLSAHDYIDFLFISLSLSREHIPKVLLGEWLRLACSHRLRIVYRALLQLHTVPLTLSIFFSPSLSFFSLSLSLSLSLFVSFTLCLFITN